MKRRLKGPTERYTDDENKNEQSYAEGKIKDASHLVYENLRSKIRRKDHRERIRGLMIRKNMQGRTGSGKTDDLPVSSPHEISFFGRTMGKVRDAAVKTGKSIVKKSSLIAVAAAAAMFLVTAFASMGTIVRSPEGVFYLDETDDSAPLAGIIERVTRRYGDGKAARIEEYLEMPDFDSVAIEYDWQDGDSDAVNNWYDVISVYAVDAVMRKEDSHDVMTVTDSTEEEIAHIHGLMNIVSYTESVAEHKGITEEGKEPVTVRELKVSIRERTLDAMEAADLMEFDEEQRQVLREMTDKRDNEFIGRLTGTFFADKNDYLDIVSGLSSDGRGSLIVKAALSKLGCPYVLGAKGDRRFDCSGLVYYAVSEAVPELKGIFYTNAAGQARYLFEHGKLVGRGELMPGDLVFWRNRRCTGCGRWNEIHHVGIYAGNGKVIEASSSRGCVVIRELWSKDSYPVFMYGRPF